jgi:hypothetical protein
VKTLLQFALASALLTAAAGCDFQVFSQSPNAGASGAFCLANSDCLSKSCQLEPYTDPPAGKCG